MKENAPFFSTRMSVAVIVLTSAAMFVLRFFGPTDLMDFGQELPTAYTLDLVHNHHWIVQWDNYGDIASKPPLHTWLAALCSALLGGVSQFSLCLPSGLAVLGTALVLFFQGRRIFGERAGFTAAILFLLSMSTFKAVTLVRVDTVFAFGVTLAAILVFNAWQSGTGWTTAWIVTACVMLTKGPLGIVLVFSGLLAALWERKTHHAQPIKGTQWKGVLLFCLLAGGWFGLAWHQAGHQLVEKLFAKELIHHVMTNGVNEKPGQHPHYPALYFLSRFAPWSIFSCMGFWRVLRRTAAGAEERQFERFLFCWFVLGLVLFSATPHQRGDLLWPVIPAAALLAGRELARFVHDWSQPRLAFAFAVAAAIMFAGSWWEYYYFRAEREPLLEARAIVQFADELKKRHCDNVILTPVAISPFLHLRLGNFSSNISTDRAVALLQGPERVFIVINHPSRLRTRLAESGRLHVLAEGTPTRFTHLQLVSNYPGPP